MLYVKYKEITKRFDFSEYIKLEDLPGYIRHYVAEDEKILSAFKTIRDHGVFTDKKIVLFDNYSKSGIHKQIYTIPYNTISTMSIVFNEKSAEIDLLLNSGHPIRLTFVDVSVKDKVRLRVLYTAITRIISGQEPNKVDAKRLVENDF